MRDLVVHALFAGLVLDESSHLFHLLGHQLPRLLVASGHPLLKLPLDVLSQSIKVVVERGSRDYLIGGLDDSLLVK